MKNNRPVAEKKNTAKWEHLETVCLSQQWSDNKYSQKRSTRKNCSHYKIVSFKEKKHNQKQKLSCDEKRSNKSNKIT